MADSKRPLSEAAARRLLARAVELDARLGSELTVEDLRTAALEAGVAPTAFDQAVQELAAESTSSSPARSLRHTITVNTLAGGAFFLAVVILDRVADFAGVGWQLRHAADILALAIGAGVAHGLGARLARVILVGLGASQLALWIIHLLWGIENAQGGPTQFAVMGAGVIAAITASVLARRRPAAMDAQAASAHGVRPDLPESLDPPTRARVRIPHLDLPAPSAA